MITYINRTETEDRHFYNLVNNRHDTVTLERADRAARKQERIYCITKKIFAFCGVALFLVCLWALR